MENQFEDIKPKGSLDVTIKLRPGSSAAEIKLLPGQEFTAEAGAMIAMSPSIQMQTTTYKKNSGGIMKGLKRMLSGESFFLNHYSAGYEEGTVWLGATHAGDMMVKELNGEGLVCKFSGTGTVWIQSHNTSTFGYILGPRLKPRK